MGDTLRIHYNPAKPESATTRSAQSVSTRILLPLGVAAAVGLAGVVGSLYTASSGGFNGFFGGYAVTVLAAVALYCFLSTYWRHTDLSWWHERAVATGVVDKTEIVNQPTRRESYRSVSAATTRRPSASAGNQRAPGGAYPTVTFTTGDGRKVKFKEQVSTVTEPGSSVRVYYDPEFPEQTATIVSRGRALRQVWTPAIVGIVMLAFAAVFAIAQFTGSS